MSHSSQKNTYYNLRLLENAEERTLYRCGGLGKWSAFPKWGGFVCFCIGKLYLFLSITIKCTNGSANYTNVYIFCYKLKKQAFLKLFHGIWLKSNIEKAFSESGESGSERTDRGWVYKNQPLLGPVASHLPISTFRATNRLQDWIAAGFLRERRKWFWKNR